MGDYLQGLAIGLGLIMAIGAQNVFIIKQGLSKGNVYTAAVTSATCDAILIFIGIYGLSSLSQKLPAIETTALYLGIGFLFFYGISLCYNALRANPQGWAQVESAQPKLVAKITRSKFHTFTTALAFSLLNPHVYLDTLIILGGIGAEKKGDFDQIFFGLGGASASYLWFFATGYLAAKLEPVLRSERCIRAIDMIIGLVVIALSAGLLQSKVI